MTICLLWKHIMCIKRLLFMFTATIIAPVIAIMTFNLYAYYLLLLLPLSLYAQSKRGQNRTLGRKWAAYWWRRG